MLAVLTRPLGRLLASAGLVVIVAMSWFGLQVEPIFSSGGRSVMITVHPGDSIAVIAGQMYAKGIIASPLAFRIDSLLQGAPLVRPGSYELKQGSSFPTVRSILSNPPNVPMISVTPGLTLREVESQIAQDIGTTYANSFAAAASADAAKSPFGPLASLEGLIGIGQYLVTPTTTPSQLAGAMTSSFIREATNVGLTPTSTVNGLNAYQIIIAASIVEKEGYYAQYMPQVARVIFNRLQIGQKLQMDSTVLYYYGQDGGVVTRAMLQTKTPYNTYWTSGLTPTPICSVSSTALRSVLHAPSGPWLYFVLVDKSGTMLFSSTLQQQLANEQLAARNGLG